MLKSIWLWVIGALVGALVLVRSVFYTLLFRRVRIGAETAAALYDCLQARGRLFVIEEEWVTAERNKLPVMYDALCILDKKVFRFIISERMLRAGFEKTDSVATVTAFRWQVRKLLEAATVRPEKIVDIPVYILQSWDGERICRLKIPEEISEPYMESSSYGPFETTVQEVLAGERLKTGAILYGPPGNGKSYLARYLALKYEIPIYLVVLTSDTSNKSIIRMFGHLRGPAIVLFEDFDVYFRGRECLLPKAEFTFDAILNVLDGTYADLEGIVSVMTCNRIEQVDPALRERPSRFRHIIEIGCPTTEIRKRVFAGHPNAAALTEELAGCNLDELLAARDSEGLARQARERVRGGEQLESKPLFFVEKREEEVESGKNCLAKPSI